MEYPQHIVVPALGTLGKMVQICDQNAFKALAFDGTAVGRTIFSKFKINAFIDCRRQDKSTCSPIRLILPGDEIVSSIAKNYKNKITIQT